MSVSLVDAVDQRSPYHPVADDPDDHPWRMISRFYIVPHSHNGVEPDRDICDGPCGVPIPADTAFFQVCPIDERRDFPVPFLQPNGAAPFLYRQYWYCASCVLGAVWVQEIG